MNQDERARVIHGQVVYKNQWVSIEEKQSRDKEFRKRIEQGYVLFQGEWITIDEKLARVTTAQTPAQQTQQTVYNNPVINRQVYNIQANTDNRSFTQKTEDHRHVHIDPASIPPPAWEQQQQGFSQYLNQNYPPQQIGPSAQGQQALNPPQMQSPPQAQQGPPRQIPHPPPPKRLPPPPDKPLPKDAPEYFYGEDEQGDSQQPPS